MNNKGQVVIVRTMIFITALILAIVIITPLKEALTDARSPDQLNCTSADITFGQKATCLEVDLMLPIFIGVVMGVAGNILYRPA